jgi:hypothetical protein
MLFWAIVDFENYIEKDTQYQLRMVRLLSDLEIQIIAWDLLVSKTPSSNLYLLLTFARTQFETHTVESSGSKPEPGRESGRTNRTAPLLLASTTC